MTAGVTLDAVACAARDGGADAVSADAARGAIDCHLSASALLAFADRLSALGLQTQWIAAADTRATRSRLTLAYHFAPPNYRPSLARPTARSRTHRRLSRYTICARYS